MASSFPFPRGEDWVAGSAIPSPIHHSRDVTSRFGAARLQLRCDGYEHEGSRSS
jgi:hypothetical protein